MIELEVSLVLDDVVVLVVVVVTTPVVVEHFTENSNKNMNF